MVAPRNYFFFLFFCLRPISIHLIIWQWLILALGRPPLASFWHAASGMTRRLRARTLKVSLRLPSFFLLPHPWKWESLVANNISLFSPTVKLLVCFPPRFFFMFAEKKKLIIGAVMSMGIFFLNKQKLLACDFPKNKKRQNRLTVSRNTCSCERNPLNTA